MQLLITKRPLTTFNLVSAVVCFHHDWSSHFCQVMILTCQKLHPHSTNVHTHTRTHTHSHTYTKSTHTLAYTRLFIGKQSLAPYLSEAAQWLSYMSLAPLSPCQLQERTVFNRVHLVTGSCTVAYLQRHGAMPASPPFHLPNAFLGARRGAKQSLHSLLAVPWFRTNFPEKEENICCRKF
jgi:uncharacterized membrane protein